ncbi:DUF6037 family protein [Mycoplasmopsis gallinarum]|uniref:DUF6037 family protein n=1 Tax=Mycoplasmopsis gallinarum TaxID=29557 RepID=UPI00048A2EF1|nr:DUF6037 family protein [Mycoplasmopsis gallinarum]
MKKQTKHKNYNLINLLSLLSYLKRNDMNCTLSIFRYKWKQYWLIVQKLNKNDRKRNKSAIAKLIFIEVDDKLKTPLREALEIETDGNKLFMDWNTLNNYFKIEFKHHMKRFIEQLNNSLSYSWDT